MASPPPTNAQAEPLSGLSKEDQAVDAPCQEANPGSSGWFRSSDDEDTGLELIAAIGVAVIVALAPSLWNAMGFGRETSRRLPAHAAVTRNTSPRASKKAPDQQAAVVAKRSLAAQVAVLPVRNNQDRSEGPKDGLAVRLVVQQPEKQEAARHVAPIETQLSAVTNAITGRLPDLARRLREEVRGAATQTLLQDDTSTSMSSPSSDSSLSASRTTPHDEPEAMGGEHKPSPDQRVDQASRAFETGLHHFWRNDLATAIRSFETASRYESEEPTYRYFLALARYLGDRRSKAEQDLAAAVLLEREFPAPDLGQQLQRIQGPHRIWLENARRHAQVGPYRPRSRRERKLSAKTRPIGVEGTGLQVAKTKPDRQALRKLNGRG